MTDKEIHDKARQLALELSELGFSHTDIGTIGGLLFYSATFDETGLPKYRFQEFVDDVGDYIESYV